jgi:outer membrane protein assembly factor BamB
MRLRRLPACTLAAACLLAFIPPALALIERLTPLATILADADEVFVAHFERIDPEKPSALLVWDKDLQGETPHRRLPVNLTGDKEKHTPEFLKRIAPKLPAVLFVTSRDDKYLALGYIEGTWFQLIGTKADDGTGTRWVFTHCEIYLRRTFTGTTKEMIAVVTDAVAGKKKPPKPNPREPPGFGPEVKPEEKTENQKPSDDGQVKSEIRDTRYDVGAYPRGPRLFAAVPARGLQSELLSTHVSLLFVPAIGVVTLPFLAPLAVLLQLLFPGLLRDQWRQYRIAISVLMTQSTLLAVHWAVVRWGVTVRPRWLADDVLWGAMVAVAFVGLVAAGLARWRQSASAAPPRLRPVPVEYIAVWVLLLAGIGWAAFLLFTRASPIDQMFVATLAASAAAAHLWFRSRRSRSLSAGAPPRLTTELVLLSGLVLAGAGLGLFVNAEEKNQVAGTVTAEWPMFRGSPARTGSATADDPGPAAPEILWVFDPKERKGRIRMHSSPAVVDGQVFIGALYELQSLTEGAVYCVNAADGRAAGDQVQKAGGRTWRFTADGTLKPVFSSPTIAGGRLYVGEGYHQDQNCRLFCLDARTGELPLWTFPTASHVESSPCLVGSRLFIGAGDDGILCLDLDDLSAGDEQAAVPKQIWQFPNVHVDGSCLVADGSLFVGSVMGDVYRDFCALAIDAATGQGIWRVTAPMPLPASPAYADRRVYFGLGNGKFDVDADHPAGAVWCLNAAKGEPVWQFETAGSVLATPAIAGERLIACARDARCYCLSRETGDLLWKVNVGGPINASPIVAGGKVYVLTVSGLLACLAIDDGRELWRLTLDVPDDDAYSSPTLAAGKLYVAAGGRLYCIGDKPPEAH